MEPSDKAMDLAVSSRQAMNSGIHLITIAKTSPTSVLAVLLHRAAAFPRQPFLWSELSRSALSRAGGLLFLLAGTRCDAYPASVN
jgi:hypothetical protein